MPRCLLHFLTTVSLAACAVAVLLWVFSESLPVEIPVGDGEWAIQSRAGRLRYDNAPAGRRAAARLEAYRAERDRILSEYRESRKPGDPPPALPAAPPGVRPASAFSIDYWLPCGITAAAGLCGYLLTCRDQRVRRRRAGAGLCPSCGYDLRATPGRCPECGS